ncbi:hypothetical protein P6144_01960 [Sphingomonas sp. HITSZ_GF]|uniref:hypothetical protein n=1 Tax=Sphingomonas sp. HITSZ_GF TaxID=3037247 RepID=UPI00240D1EF3|nr:hypothetical protein [Sphingomonas sp. HITSZ_GF]MDG2532397.1 hypothetical protein [Sphingomonas sp. HITSZ_GF]
MDPTPIILGMVAGSMGTLAIQSLAQRKVKRALADAARTAPEAREQGLQRRETLDMHNRLAVLEEIVTDQPRRLEAEIDSLR